MLRQVVCPYVRATPSLQGTQLYLLAKVIIFSVIDNVSTDIIAAKSLQIVLAATMLLHNNLLVASYMKGEAAKLSAVAFNKILKRDLVNS